MLLSTSSQLGFILRILCLNLNNLTFLHLFIHALFKSIIFICVWRFIHYTNGIQNFRFYKGIFCIYPIKRIIIIFPLTILCGFPFLVGFYSKDLIIEVYFFNKIILCLIFLLFSTILIIFASPSLGPPPSINFSRGCVKRNIICILACVHLFTRSLMPKWHNSLRRETGYIPLQRIWYFFNSVQRVKMGVEVTLKGILNKF